MIPGVQGPLSVFLALGVPGGGPLGAPHCTLVYPLLIALVAPPGFVLTVLVVGLVKHTVSPGAPIS